MKKKIVFLVVFLAVLIIISIPIIANIHNKLDSTKWFMQDIELVADQYIQENFSDASRVRIRNYFFEYGETEVQTAQNTDSNPYPFTRVRVNVRINSVDYIIYIVPDEKGVLYVEQCILAKDATPN